MFQIDFASRVPIYEQLIKGVIRLVSVGVIKEGDKLPPVRVLASQLGVNPNTVAKAYRSLESDGYICSVVGRGTYITDKLSEVAAEKSLAIDSFKAASEKAMLFGASKQELEEILDSIFEGGKEFD